MKNNILAIDTSTEYITIAVADQAEPIGCIHRKAPRSHSSLLMGAIDSLLKRSRIRLKDIEVFCIGIGPGSFTGLRIGVATIKALAYVTAKPIVAVPTFDVIAWNARHIRGIICPVLDARKNKVYASFYRSDGRGNVKKISAYLLVPVEELLKRCRRYDNIYFLGDYAEKVAELLPGARIACKRWHPRAGILATLGVEGFKKRRFVSAEKLEPMYIYSRECDITGV